MSPIDAALIAFMSIVRSRAIDRDRCNTQWNTAGTTIFRGNYTFIDFQDLWELLTMDEQLKRAICNFFKIRNCDKQFCANFIHVDLRR